MFSKSFGKWYNRNLAKVTMFKTIGSSERSFHTTELESQWPENRTQQILPELGNIKYFPTIIALLTFATNLHEETMGSLFSSSGQFM